MAAPNFQAFHEFVLEVAPTTPGVYVKLCGITGRSVNRSLNIQETEVPKDCGDESLGTEVRLSPGALAVGVDGTAKWARESHQVMMDWIYLKQRLPCRLRHANAAVGDTEFESGYAYMTTLNDSAEMSGANRMAMERTIALRFDGEPTRTARVA